MKGCLPAGKQRAQVLVVTAPMGRVRVGKGPTVVSGLPRLLFFILRLQAEPFLGPQEKTFLQLQYFLLVG